MTTRRFGRSDDGIIAALSTIQTTAATGALYSADSPRLVFAAGGLANVEGLPAPGDPGAGDSIPSDIRGGARLAMATMAATGQEILFEEAEGGEAGGAEAPLNAADLILDHIGTVDAGWVSSRLGDRSLKPVMAGSPSPLQPGMAMGPLEAFILNAADGKTTYNGIIALSGSAEEDVSRALCGLLCVGLLESGAPTSMNAGEAEKAPRQEVQAPAPAAKPAPRRDASALDDFLKKTSAPAADAEQDPPTASAPEPEPPQVSAPAPETAPESRPEPAPPPPAEQAGQEAQEPPAPDTPDESQTAPEVQEKRGRLQAWIAEISGADHFKALGVDPAATEEQIRRAYYKLARRYHPDRYYGPDYEDLRPQAEKAFAAATEAYNTLADQTSRAEYERDLSAGAAGPQKPEVDKGAAARESYIRAKKHLEAEEPFDALRLLEEACKADPSKEDYWLLLGTVQAKNPRWRKKAEESYQKAAEINPTSPRAYLLLGKLYQSGNLARRAAEMFKKVLEWDPENEEALEALEQKAEAQGANVASRFRSIFKGGKS